MTDLQTWSLIIGALVPPIYAIVMQSRWSVTLRTIVSVFLSVIIGFGTAYFEGRLTGARFVTSALLITLTSITTYHTIWSRTAITNTIEKSTNL